MSDEPYQRLGLSASQLDAALQSEADAVRGEVIATAFAGRGGVLWEPGKVRLVGPVGEEFRGAIDALLAGVSLESGTHVRDALLTMGGARLVVHRLLTSRTRPHLPRAGAGE